MSRESVIHKLVDAITRIKTAHPLRVAVDGIDAAGKTSLANELVKPLKASGRDVIRASIDGFHNPSEVRYRQGKDSAEGYFADSFNYEALIESLLKPLGADGNLEYQTSVFDFQSDTQVNPSTHHAQKDSILILDGVFLLRPELINYWDFSIFVAIDFDVCIERASQRDQNLFGSAEEVRKRYWKRYVPGQRMYLRACQPKTHADIIIDNNDFMHPRII